MVIVLPTADFSANNIGQVETEVVINPFTEAAITASGNATMTNEQKAALNTFFKTIGAFGTESNIWSKLNYAFLPFLASAVGNSLVDYKTNDVFVTPGENWTLRSKGLFPETGASAITKVVDKFGGPDISFIYYKCESGSSDPGASASFVAGGVRGKTNTSLWIGSIIERMASDGSSLQLEGLNITPVFYWGATTDIKGARGISISGTSGYIKLPQKSGNDSVVLSSALESFTGETQVTLYIGNQNMKRPMGALLIGGTLTSAELLTITNALNTLGSYFVS